MKSNIVGESPISLRAHAKDAARLSPMAQEPLSSAERMNKTVDTDLNVASKNTLLQFEGLEKTTLRWKGIASGSVPLTTIHLTFIHCAS